ncbi:cohesin subunit SA-1 isoform X1 [Octopus vulgaris]|uniref:Cohesin subunit SA-1 isoform X1 n=2 Tax=Octopus TaxID=6643 RepID=A0AA36FEW8_OCTVU|nr:cohesin subunit SA-1 isoform X1 [Octopus sinensis]CAI9736491.1 cohesin subunit SA-1 isoform X1 [Octopus vulgaris]
MPGARPTRKAKENAREVALAVANNGKIPRKRLQPIAEQEIVPVIPSNMPSGLPQGLPQAIPQGIPSTIPHDFQQVIAHDISQTIPLSIPQVIPQPVPPVPQESNETLDVPPELSIAAQENDSDSDFEEGKIKAKRKGRNEAPSAKRRRGGTGGQQSNKKGAAAMSNMEEEPKDGSLFDIVRYGRVSLQSLIDDWIEAYKNDRDAALLELIQFFIQCSGCKGKITPYMYSNMEHAEIIRKMTEEFDEESGDYPLIMTGPQWKKFKTNYCEFVQTLVRQCQYSIIYDQYMMDNVISLLTGLTDSQVRAFRHTSTLAAMKLMTALVDVALNLSINLDNTQRQYESERQKNQNKRATERLDLLMTKRQELEENQEEIRNMLTYIFKGVFVHRYRDTQPEIRAICSSEIGVWMRKYPYMFLDDSYLKYVGWTLHDKVGDVRLCCLKALQPLYDTRDLAPKLELFTNRFKDRIVEMTLDKEYEVAVQAVKLVISILRYNESVLTDKDCENVYELVYSSHRQVAQAAGEFLNAKLFQKDDESLRCLKISKGKRRSPNTPLIRDLVQFFIESELHEHGAYLVDSLWDINDMMKDWECMTDLLLEDTGKDEESLDDRRETSLIEIMVCCVKQAATGESPVGRGPNRKLTAKENKLVLEDKTKLTEHFIQTLPLMLLKYLMDSEKVANLLQIPQYFDLDIYTSSRQEKNLEALLRYLHEIVEKHTDSEVLEAASKCYECLCSEEYAIGGKCDVAKKTLVDNLVSKFKESMQDFFAEGEQPDEDETFALLASLKRIYAFYCCHDLNTWELWDDVFHIVKTANENNAIPEEVICKAISTCSMAIMWWLQKLDENNPDKENIRVLKRRLIDLMRYCNELIFHSQDKVSEEAYITICDLLIVFSKHLGENALLKALIYEPDKNLQAQLCGFLSEKVFVEDDDEEMDENVKIEELHKKRNFLAAFCKLVVYNITSIRTAADMFKHYMKFYNDYGDIIKATLSKAREINKVATAKTLAFSLTQLFKEVQAEQPVIDRSSDSFQAIKELARRFSLSFGLDQVKNREAVAAMHKEGILFSLTPVSNAADPKGMPPNLSFLEILCEFTNKLMKQDKKTVLNYLDKHLPMGVPTDRSDNESQPLIAYRNSLVQGEHEIHPITLRQATQKRYGTKRKTDTASGDETMDAAALAKEASNRAAAAAAASAVIAAAQASTTLSTPHLPVPPTPKRRKLEEDADNTNNTTRETERGSEDDFQDTISDVTQLSQMNWLDSSKQSDLQQRIETSNYSHLRPPNMSSLENVSEEGESHMNEFDNSDVVSARGRAHHPVMQGGLFEEDGPPIEDPSTQQLESIAFSELSHHGF